LLDEPTASLDWRAKTDILELVRLIHDARHLTTLFVTHDLGSLPVACDRVVLMKDGLIWGEGPPEELLTDDNLSQLYDMPVSAVRQRRTKFGSVNFRLSVHAECHPLCLSGRYCLRYYRCFRGTDAHALYRCLHVTRRFCRGPAWAVAGL